MRFFGNQSGRERLRASKAIAHEIAERAIAAEDAKDFLRASILYAEALRLFPENGQWRVQHDRMLNEVEVNQGPTAVSPRAPTGAADQSPSVTRLTPATTRLELYRSQVAEGAAAAKGVLAITEQELDIAAYSKKLMMSAPLAPGLASDALHSHSEEIAVQRLGKYERTPWGKMNVIRGVQAFRGFCISKAAISSIDIYLDGILVHRGLMAGGFVIPHEREDQSLRKYVFNAWIDVSPLPEGKYAILYRARDVSGRVFEREEYVVVSPRINDSSLPDSDTNVASQDPVDGRTLEEQINTRPSMVRAAKRALFTNPPRTILVLRPDALGDLVVAVPALQQLRRLFPIAKIVAVLSPGNQDLGYSLGLFDEVLVTNLTFDPSQRRRVVTVADQKTLASDLARFNFDLAIDLGTSPDSRLLLPLSGAPVLVGFRADELPGLLTVEVTGGTKDPWNGHEIVPHTNMAIGLISWLEAMMRSEPTFVRTNLGRELLKNFGLSPDTRFVVLHSGGRWEFSRWPHYLRLAEMLVNATDLHILLLTTDDIGADVVPAALAKQHRFQILKKRLTFDELDSLVSYCSVFVGDDSGVKHLASMRGTPVIGIHNARNNWSEWGHDNNGFVVTRKVPCAGCLIQNYPESDECGRDFVCIKAIQPDEILSAVQTLLSQASEHNTVEAVA